MIRKKISFLDFIGKFCNIVKVCRTGHLWGLQLEDTKYIARIHVVICALAKYLVMNGQKCFLEQPFGCLIVLSLNREV